MNNIISQLKELMIEHLRMVQSADQIEDNAELTQLGMDSMSATNLMIDIEDEFDIKFTDDLLTPETFFSPATLAEAVAGLLKDQAAA